MGSSMPDKKEKAHQKYQEACKKVELLLQQPAGKEGKISTSWRIWEQESNDPRRTGEISFSIPCFEDGHSFPQKKQSNQYAEWITCEKCGLRFAYNTLNGSSGRYKEKLPEPHVVKEALVALEREGAVRHMQKGIVKDMIAKVAANHQQQRCS